ncbi:MAG TPA: ATP-binding protein [Terriglobia bacterium]|nr:ATP-binding protein [Terriglobia bacterium]
MRLSDAYRAVSRRWLRVAHSISAKLVILLVALMAAVFGFLGYLNIRLQRHQLERSTLASAERVSDVIKNSASYYMLRNQRDGLYHTILDIAHEPGIVRIRIFNKEGRFSFSSDTAEIDTLVDKRAEACYGCHSQTEPLTRLNRPDRFRTYRLASGQRVLGIINPIENSPECSNASCHVHPAGMKVLGVLDTDLSLAAADASIAAGTRRMLFYTLLAIAIISSLSAFFVWRVVRRPLKTLEDGTERLASGNLGYQLEVRSHDELADLARSFNTMSRQLKDAREEITEWGQTLEQRVEQKTLELNRAHEQMMRVEKMASIGKLAAVVAHEINNPLAGILTYAKLLKKQFAKEKDKKYDGAIASLDLIESESWRCGEIIKNLLTFARTGSAKNDLADLNAVIKRCVQLVQHQLNLQNIQAQLELPADLPMVPCDPAQIEQVILALVMNAIAAMPQGGKLVLRSRKNEGRQQVEIDVEDSGVGIPPELMSHMFEPFFTTKERGHGLGLGLAICRTIVDRHQGRIDVESEPGRGTKFTITLPLEVAEAMAQEPTVINGRDSNRGRPHGPVPRRAAG